MRGAKTPPGDHCGGMRMAGDIGANYFKSPMLTAVSPRLRRWCLSRLRTVPVLNSSPEYTQSPNVLTGQCPIGRRFTASGTPPGAGVRELGPRAVLLKVARTRSRTSPSWGRWPCRGPVRGSGSRATALGEGPLPRPAQDRYEELNRRPLDEIGSHFRAAGTRNGRISSGPEPTSARARPHRIFDHQSGCRVSPISGQLTDRPHVRRIT